MKTLITIGGFILAGAAVFGIHYAISNFSRLFSKKKKKSCCE